MKKLIPLTLALLLLFTLAACGSAEKEEKDVDIAAEKVAAYVKDNRELIINGSDIFNDILALALTLSGDNAPEAVVKAEGRGIILMYIFETDFTSANTTTLDQLIPPFLEAMAETHFNSIHPELPELESCTVQLCKSDRSVWYEYTYIPAVKTATDAQ